MFSSCELCGDHPTEHQQEHVSVGSLAACVDRGVAPLVRLCWQMELATLSSCEDYLWSGRAALEFVSSDNVTDFLTRIVAGADGALRRRVLEGDDEDSWTVQANVRLLEVDGVEPVLRLGIFVLMPMYDIEACRQALISPASQAAVPDQEEAEWADYDDRDLVAIVTDVLFGRDPRAWEYVTICADEDVAEAVEALRRSGWLPPASLAVPGRAQLALAMLMRAEADLPEWEEASMADFRGWVSRVRAWWFAAVAVWPRLHEVDDHAPTDPPDLVSYDNDVRLALRTHTYAIAQSLAGEDLSLLLEDLWFVAWQATQADASLDWLESHGNYPHADARSPVSRRAAQAQAREMHKDPLQGLRDKTTQAWPRAAAVALAPNGRRAQFRDLDAAGEGTVVPLAEGTREEYADHAHDVLALPPVLDGWACRMIFAAGRKPVRIEFLECAGSWTDTAVTALQPYDIVRLPGSKYAWQVEAVHRGDHDEEVQLQFSALGLPVFAIGDRLSRWSRPAKPPPGFDAQV